MVTGAPNFPSGVVHEGYRNRPYAVDYMDGIRVVRVWTYMAANKGRIRRSLDYLSYMLSSIPAALAQRRPDVVVGTSPQLLAGVAALTVARMKRRPFVFEVRDLWPESISAVGAASGPLVRLLERVADTLYREAALIVSVTESFVRILAERGISRDRLVVVRNGVDLETFHVRPRDEGLLKSLGVDPNRFVATYVGTLGMAHALSSVLECAELTRDEPVQYLLVGDGAEKPALETRTTERGLANVTFTGKLPREMIPRVLSSSDAVLVHLRDDPLFRTVIPSKIFEAMAAGRPIVLGVRGESAEIVTEAEAGIVVKPEFPPELAAAVTRLRNDPGLVRGLGANGRRAAEEKYERRAAALRMLEALKRVSSRQ